VSAAHISMRDLPAVHDELERLLALGQPPAVAVMLCRRFLDAISEMGSAVWAGYGFHVAIEMARRIPSVCLEGLAPEDLSAMRGILDRARGFEVPPLPGADEWPEACDRALAALTAAAAGAGSNAAAPADHYSRVEIRIPVIANPIGANPTHPVFAGISVGQIIRLSVAADLTDHGPRLMVDGATSAELRRAFEDAISLLDGATRTRGGPCCLYHARWNAPDARLVGRSATLPFFLACAAARSAISPGVRTASLPPGIAATGDIGGMRIRAVEPSTLSAKVRAAFHAEVPLLLVPKEQEAEARDEAARLLQLRDGPPLEVIGLDDLRDALRSPRVLQRRFRSPWRIVSGWLHWLTRSRFRIAIIGFAAVLLAALAVWGSFATRNLPVDGEWRRDDLVLRNKHGWICRRIPLPYAPLDVNVPTPFGTRLLVTDLNRDGIGDAIAIRSSFPGPTDLLTAIDRHGRPLWQLRSRDVHGVMESDVTWHGFALIPLMEGNDPEILAVRRSTQRSLSVIDRIDARTGESLGSLRNWGHMETLVWPDPAREGSPHPVCLGTDNTDGDALVAILDPARMTIPATMIDSLEEIPGLTEPRALDHGLVAAWRFPKDRFSRQPRSSCCCVTEENGGVVVEVRGDSAFDAVLYHLTVHSLERPEVTRVQFTDAYRSNIRRRTPGIAPEAVDQEEGRLRGEVRTLTPSGWEVIR